MRIKLEDGKEYEMDDADCRKLPNGDLCLHGYAHPISETRVIGGIRWLKGETRAAQTGEVWLDPDGDIHTSHGETSGRYPILTPVEVVRDNG